MRPLRTPLEVRVLSRKAAESFRGDRPYIMLSIADRFSECAVLPVDSHRKSTMFTHFDDCSFAERYAVMAYDAEGNENVAYNFKPITKRQARDIWFWFLSSRHLADMLVVNCEAGISRSAAVAAALLEGIGLDSSYCYQPPRVPNAYVKMVMMRVRRENRDLW